MAVAGGALVLFRHFKLPPVLGYLLAGIIIGPFTLPNPPVQNVDTIRLLADLGLVLLLFGIGLELGWQRIRQVGARVILIALMQMTIMFALGYEIAALLGWARAEGVFLGAALSISSSAILVKMLRDTGTLFATRGRLIVGILVVEDFVAVILLTVLSGVSTASAATPTDIGTLAGKLAIFGVAALVFGALFAPRLIRFVNRFRSDETLLIASLALCFGLALAGQQLGLSAASGAFLIGMVLGDTDHAQEISRIMNPVKDMFAALFFVSIGMLMDIRSFTDFLAPALIISGVFITGKVVANTLGRFWPAMTAGLR
jgi:monovalent cation:H+ antiporter-2, CPA2 family